MMRLWAFPRHRPQIYAPTGRSLAGAQALYSYGRNLPTAVRLGISSTLALPGVRRLVSEPTEVELPMSESTWQSVLATGSDVVGLRNWALFRSSWRERRFLVFAFDARHRCTGVIHVFDRDEATFHPNVQAELFRIPKIIDSRDIGRWHLRIVEPLPVRHRPHPWDPVGLHAIARDIARVLAETLARPVEASESWVPIHGDLTPWNLRVDGRGRVWLLDWEWATWGPRIADILRYAITYRSLVSDDPSDMTAWISQELVLDEDTLADAARYWLAHRIYRRDVEHLSRIEGSNGVKAIRDQNQIEALVLEMLAEGSLP
jgi:hypothetical protein